MSRKANLCKKQLNKMDYMTYVGGQVLSVNSKQHSQSSKKSFHTKVRTLGNIVIVGILA